MRVYECRYVRKDDPGDLLWGFHWRPAVIVDEMRGAQRKRFRKMVDTKFGGLRQ